MTDSAPTYRQLLAGARELGRLDGRLAAAFEPAGSDVGHRCLLPATRSPLARSGGATILRASRHGNATGRDPSDGLATGLRPV